MHLEEHSGLRGDVDAGGQKHTWRTWEQCAVDEGAFGGYNCKKLTRRIRRSS